MILRRSRLFSTLAWEKPSRITGLTSLATKNCGSEQKKNLQRKRFSGNVEAGQATPSRSWPQAAQGKSSHGIPREREKEASTWCCDLEADAKRMSRTGDKWRNWLRTKIPGEVLSVAYASEGVLSERRKKKRMTVFPGEAGGGDLREEGPDICARTAAPNNKTRITSE